MKRFGSALKWWKWERRRRKWEREHKWSKADWDEIDVNGFEEVPSEEEIGTQHAFTPEFEERMKLFFEFVDTVFEAREEILAREQAEKARKARRRKAVARRVWHTAAAAMCLILTLSIGFSVVRPVEAAAVQEIVVEVFQEWFDDFVSTRWGSNQKERSEVVVLEASPVPDGYVETFREIGEDQYFIIYKNIAGEEIVISGRIVVAGLVDFGDVGDQKKGELTVNGYTCDVYVDKLGGTVVKWKWNESLYSVTCVLVENEMNCLLEGIISQTVK